MSQNQDSSDDNFAFTCKSYIIVQQNTRKCWGGYNKTQSLQFASLTKMYTLYSCLCINSELNIRPQLSWVHILQSTTSGTLAQLALGKQIKIIDLYYAMMLPSGNDASLNLAYYYGYLLGRKDRDNKDSKDGGFSNYQWRNQKEFNIQGKRKYARLYLARFMSYMNQAIVHEKLKHTNTHFQNPHGMSDKLQRSNAFELAYATIQFLNHSLFKKIVETQEHTSYYSDGEEFTWQNTNILLKDGYTGVKTGFTNTAGGCLASRRVLNVNRKRYDAVIIVLGSKGQEERFKDTKIILRNFIKYLKVME